METLGIHTQVYEYGTVWSICNNAYLKGLYSGRGILSKSGISLWNMSGTDSSAHQKQYSTPKAGHPRHDLYQRVNVSMTQRQNIYA